MSTCLKNAFVYENGSFVKKDITAEGSFSKSENLYVFPGFVDVHVHLREPGFSYKETIKTGTLAAAHGGYTAVCSMPNLNPTPDSLENIKIQIEKIKTDANIAVYPYACITVGERGEELTDIKELKRYAIAFSDDGRGVQSEEMMLRAMEIAKQNDAIIAAHCEDNSLLFGGYIHDGEYAKNNGHKGISSESEYSQIERDLKLAEKTGCKYHVCHISTKESVELIRKAKARGVDVTCETGPHYLVLSDKDLKEDGRFKMNPPLRSESDRLALIEGIKDGTIDMIATDHAPHSFEEKSKGLAGSLMGVVGLETAFSVLYTNLVKTGIITLEKLIELMSINPAKRFSIKNDGYTVFDLSEEYVVNPDNFYSMGKSTPFLGKKLYGVCKTTVYNKKAVF